MSEVKSKCGEGNVRDGLYASNIGAANTGDMPCLPIQALGTCLGRYRLRPAYQSVGDRFAHPVFLVPRNFVIMIIQSWCGAALS